MYLTLKAGSDIRIFVDDELSDSFEKSYYPLGDDTSDILISSFSKEHRARISTLCESEAVPQSAIDEIAEIVQNELRHALDLVDECRQPARTE